MARRQPVVLIVEDHEDSLAMYAIAFTASGFSVLSATDATAAFALACACMPDAVVIDERLPDRPGTELAGELSGHEATRAAALLILTGDARARPRAVAAGCDQFLLKPCRPDRLVLEVSQALAARHASQPGLDTRPTSADGCGPPH